jgi:O-antigen/teichoic acid export membrane protein
VIDTWGVLANSLWILGLAVLLAVLSWARWVASMEGNRLRVVLKRPHTQQALDVGLFLFCAGLAATGRTWWERVLWGLLSAAWVVQVWLARASARRRNPSKGSR